MKMRQALPSLALAVIFALCVFSSGASAAGKCLKRTATCKMLNDTCCSGNICTMSTRCTTVDGDKHCHPKCQQPVAVNLKKVEIVPGLFGFEAGNKKSPALVVLQEWWGVNEPIKETTFYLGQQGYRVIIPDLYRGVMADNATDAMKLSSGLNWTQAVRDMNETVNYLRRTGAKRVAVTGFCQGGGLALCAAQFSNVVAAAPFYGAPSRTSTPCRVENIPKHIPILYQWGDKDSAGSIAGFSNATNLMKQAGLKVWNYTYASAPHAYFNFLTPRARSFATQTGRVTPTEEDIVLSFSRLTDFLAKYLRRGEKVRRM